MAGYTREQLVHLYATMQRIRLCEEGFVQPILDREVLCPAHLTSGQEAIAAGVCLALRKEDTVFGTHRSHGHYLAKGGPLREMVAEVFCRETGCAGGRGGSMHVVWPDAGVMGVAPIVGGTIALAVGAAMASRVRGDSTVAVTFFGDGATGEGVLAESMNFAAIYKLPVLFVCENNLYSTHLPIRECRATNNIFEMSQAFGFEGRRVDGNKVLDVYDAAKAAVRKLRAGKGPVLLECMTYRLRGHVGPDDNVQGSHIDIRPPSEIARWRRRDPLLQFERYLRDVAGFTADEIASIRDRVAAEVDDAFQFARASAFPSPDTLMSHVTA